jgi:hypothetical protein
MKKIEEYTFFNTVTGKNQTQKSIVTFGPNGERLNEEDYYGSTAEEWLNFEEYTAMRLISLLDAEAKLLAAGKSSPKLNAVRSWINQIMAGYVANPQPRNDWTVAPFHYQETIDEAFNILNT